MWKAIANSMSDVPRSLMNGESKSRFFLDETVEKSARSKRRVSHMRREQSKPRPWACLKRQVQRGLVLLGKSKLGDFAVAVDIFPGRHLSGGFLHSVGGARF